MKEKIQRILELVRLYWGAIASVIAAVAFIGGLAVKSYVSRMEKSQLQSDIIELKQAFKSFSDTSITFYKRIDSRQNRIERNVMEMSVELSTQGGDIIALKEGFAKHLLRDKGTYQEFLEYMRSIDFELKKKDLNGLPGIPWQP